MNKKILLAILMWAFSYAPLALAQPVVKSKQNHYKVYGSNINEIKESIKTNGVLSPNGKYFAAKTDYDISWNPSFTTNSYGCLVENTNVSVAINYYLPALADAKKLNRRDRNKWRKYYKSLQAHEQMHAKFGVWAAEEISWEMKNMLPAETCDILSDSIDNLAESVIDKYHRKNIHFDYATSHGYNQGVIL